MFSFIQTSDELYKKAVKAKDDGDDEKAYIHYMKYFKLVKAIRTMKDFEREKDFFSKLMGITRAKDSLDVIERLQRRLKERYIFYLVYSI